VRDEDQVIENPVSGERIVVLRTGAETGGELLRFELFLAPGGHVPSSHVHPEQEERFTVLEGRMRFRLGIRVVHAGPGDTVTVGAGTAHGFANAGPGPAHLLVEVRPALNMEEMLQTAAALTQAGNGMPRGLPRPLDLALFLREFEREVKVPLVPGFLIKTITAALTRVAGTRRLEARYLRLRAARSRRGES
jgi:quercetin dioxygenase-like cupin family protein